MKELQVLESKAEPLGVGITLRQKKSLSVAEFYNFFQKIENYLQIKKNIYNFLSSKNLMDKVKFESIQFKSFIENPNLYKDDSGIEIRIEYKNETLWWRQFFERKKHIIYLPKTKYSGNNLFVSETFRALNYIKVDELFKIEGKALSRDRVIVIKKGKIGDDTFVYKNNLIFYHPQSALRIVDNSLDKKGKPACKLTGERQSSAIGLLHELGHAYVNIYLNDNEKNTLDEKDFWYELNEEKFVIEQIESPIAKKLGEFVRYNYHGKSLTAMDVLSLRKGQKKI